MADFILLGLHCLNFFNLGGPFVILLGTNSNIF